MIEESQPHLNKTFAAVYKAQVRAESSGAAAGGASNVG